MLPAPRLSIFCYALIVFAADCFRHADYADIAAYLFHFRHHIIDFRFAIIFISLFIRCHYYCLLMPLLFFFFSPCFIIFDTIFRFDAY